MLVGAREFLHRVDVQPAFVAEGRAPDERRADVVRDVGDLVDEPRKLGEALQVGHQRHALLELEQRDERGEVAVAHALAVAVDRPLHLRRARLHGRQRVGHAETAVVVGVDARRAPEHGKGVPRRPGDKLRQAPSVRVAQDHLLGPGFLRRADRCQRIVRVVAEAVEEMLGVVKNAPPIVAEKTHGVADHRQVFVQRDPEDLGDVQRPRLADDRDHGRLRSQQLLHLAVVLDPHAAAPRHPERRQRRAPPCPPGRLFEKRRVFGVRAGPSALDEMHAERVEPLGHPQLVLHAQGNARALRAVAQGRVVNGDLRFVVHRVAGLRRTPPNFLSPNC